LTREPTISAAPLPSMNWRQCSERIGIGGSDLDAAPDGTTQQRRQFLVATHTRREHPRIAVAIGGTTCWCQGTRHDPNVLVVS
jgi:hypothetical protein